MGFVTLLGMTLHAVAGAAGSDESDPVRLVYECHPNPANIAIMDWLDAGGWCWGMTVRPETEEEVIREIARRGYRVVLSMLAHPESRSRQWTLWKLPVPSAGDVIPRLAGMASSGFVWEGFTEDDSSGVGLSQVLLKAKPKSHGEAKALYDRYLAEAMAEMWTQPDIERWGRFGFATGLHALAAQKLDCLLVERANDDIEDLQTAIAFARGAARQYACQWGVDFSLWWGVISGCVQNLAPSFHKRNFYVSYFSGANVLAIEGGDLLIKLPEVKPTVLGHCLDEFGRFTKRYLPGTPDVPAAILLPEDHGWMTPPYWRTQNTVWNYAKVPYRQGDRGIDGVFAAAFPGSGFAMDPYPLGAYASEGMASSPFALSCITPEYAPSAEDVFEAEPPIPFGQYENRAAARKAMAEQGVDPSPCRPMGDSRWGDIFDVLTTSADDKALARYRAILIAGHVTLEAPIRERLVRYVENGGTVVCAAGVVGPNDVGLTGLALIPRLLVGRAWCWEGGAAVAEAFRYVPSAPEAPGGVDILAATPSGDPLAVSHAVSEGRVYTCLVPWFEGNRVSLSGVALRLLDHVFDPLQPVTVTGLPVEWLSTRGKTERTVLVANHDAAPWTGTISVRNLPSEFSACRELLTETLVEFTHANNMARVELAVPAHDVRVLRWTCSRE